MSAAIGNDRLAWVVFCGLALAGLALGGNKGRLPEREPSSIADAASLERGAIHHKNQTSADLSLYREMITAVRQGTNYYAAGREKIPSYGFQISSPLNWRLPTYAWLFSCVPSLIWVQAGLIGLSIAALALAFTAQSRTSGFGYAAVTTFLLFGIVRWALDGDAYLAQEPWAATLILVSLASSALARGESEVGGRGSAAGRWRCLAVVAGLAALFFRELALPYCGIACLLSAWNRRWREALVWAIGIALFFAFIAWHVGQVRAQLAGTDIAASTGLSQWLRFGALDFVLLTTRMNSLLFAAPGWLLWLYLLSSLLGLSRRADESSHLACLSALAYLLAFALLGRPENFYWGLLPAPLLAWGTAHGVQVIAEWYQATRTTGSPIGSPLTSCNV